MTTPKEALERARSYVKPSHTGDVQADADLRAIDEALASLEGDAIERVAGCICQNQHRRGYCTEPGCPYSTSDAVERVARTICQSGKFETGQGTCAVICMDQLGDVRKKGCGHCRRVHGAMARAILATGLVPDEAKP